MKEQEFLEQIVDIMDCEEDVTMETILADLEEWDSLSIVSFLSYANTKLKKSITSQDVKTATTICDLYDLVK